MRLRLNIIVPAALIAVLILSSCGRSGKGDVITFDYSKMKKAEMLTVSALSDQPEFIICLRYYNNY